MKGKQLKQMLKDNGIRQTYLANLAGLSYEHLNRMLNSDHEVSDSVKLAALKEWGWE